MILPETNYTFDASAKTITITGSYDSIELAQVLLIKDLTTSEVLYDSKLNDELISISAGVITHTHESSNSSQADADKLQIVLDMGVFFLISDNNYSTVTKDWNAAVQTVFEIADDTEYEVIGISVDLTGAKNASTWTFQMHRAFAAAGSSYRTAGDPYTKVVGVGATAIEFSDIAHYGYMKLTAQSDDTSDDGKALKITYIKKPFE